MPQPEQPTAPRSAFHAVRKPNGLVCCAPPTCHLQSLVTGGLQRLFHDVSKHQQQPIHDFGAFTTEKGRFRPNAKMPLLALRYKFVKVIAEGQSCIVIKALDSFHDSSEVSIKILHLNYCKLGTQEVEVIRQLNRADPYRFASVLRLQNTFMFDDHFCMVFDCYDPNTISEHLKSVPEKDKLEYIRKVAARLTLCLGFLQSQNVIHADLKIENILLADSKDPTSVRLVDFGNAIHCVHNEMSLYYQDFELQTLLYRAPEVMYGLPFGTEVDLWSLGLVLSQLYLGKPLVLGKSKQAVTADTVQTLGPLPKKLFMRGKFYRTLEQYTQDIQQVDPVYRIMNKLSSTDYHFCDFLAGLLQYDPQKRMTPKQAATHPFLAPILGFAHITGRYSQIPISSHSYKHAPLIHDVIKRQNLTSVNLLRTGTSVRPKTPETSVQTNAPTHDRLELLRSRKRSANGTPVVTPPSSSTMTSSAAVTSAAATMTSTANDEPRRQQASTSYSDALEQDISSVSNTSHASSSEYCYVSSPESEISRSVSTAYDMANNRPRNDDYTPTRDKVSEMENFHRDQTTVTTPSRSESSRQSKMTSTAAAYKSYPNYVHRNRSNNQTSSSSGSQLASKLSNEEVMKIPPRDFTRMDNTTNNTPHKSRDAKKSRDENFNLRQNCPSALSRGDTVTHDGAHASLAGFANVAASRTPSSAKEAKIRKQRLVAEFQIDDEAHRENTERMEVKTNVRSRKEEAEKPIQRCTADNYSDSDSFDSDDTALLSNDTVLRPVRVVHLEEIVSSRTPSAGSQRSGPMSVERIRSPAAHHSKDAQKSTAHSSSQGRSSKKPSAFSKVLMPDHRVSNAAASQQVRALNKFQSPRQLAPFVSECPPESLVSGVVRSTPMVHRKQQQQRTDSDLPNFGNISPIDEKAPEQKLGTMPDVRCKKSLPFYQESKSKSGKRKRSAGSTEEPGKRKMGNRTRLLHDMFGEDVHDYRDSPRK